MPADETRAFVAGRKPFLSFLEEYFHSLPVTKLADVIQEAGGPENVSIICIDITNCFCKFGTLSSPRINALIPTVTDLFKLAHSLGIRNFMLSQDAHPADSPEFDAYGQHCVVGSEGAQTVTELKELPFSNLFQVLPKQSLNPAVAVLFLKWLEENSRIKRFIVVGDCTDLCVYQIAMYIKIRSNQYYLGQDVIVPANCVDTYDTPLDKAKELGILPHDADLLHPLFLYHMALNDIKIVRSLTE